MLPKLPLTLHASPEGRFFFFWQKHCERAWNLHHLAIHSLLTSVRERAWNLHHLAIHSLLTSLRERAWNLHHLVIYSLLASLRERAWNLHHFAIHSFLTSLKERAWNLHYLVLHSLATSTLSPTGEDSWAIQLSANLQHALNLQHLIGVRGDSLSSLNQNYPCLSSLRYHYGTSQTYAKMQLIKRQKEIYLTKLSDYKCTNRFFCTRLLDSIWHKKS